MNIDRTNILKYAAMYDNEAEPSDKEVEEIIKHLLKTQRFLTLENFIAIGLWKTGPRQRSNFRKNRDEVVREITKFSFLAKTEEARIGALLSLNGVSYPVASAILHFAFPKKYPILDFRALSSLGWPQPPSYNFEFWKKYYSHMQKLSRNLHLEIRIIDKGLWQFSKEHDKK